MHEIVGSRRVYKVTNYDDRRSHYFPVLHIRFECWIRLDHFRFGFVFVVFLTTDKALLGNYNFGNKALGSRYTQGGCTMLSIVIYRFLVSFGSNNFVISTAERNKILFFSF